MTHLDKILSYHIFELISQSSVVIFKMRAERTNLQQNSPDPNMKNPEPLAVTAQFAYFRGIRQKLLGYIWTEQKEGTMEKLMHGMPNNRDGFMPYYNYNYYN